MANYVRICVVIYSPSLGFKAEHNCTGLPQNLFSVSTQFHSMSNGYSSRLVKLSLVIMLKRYFYVQKTSKNFTFCTTVEAFQYVWYFFNSFLSLVSCLLFIVFVFRKIHRLKYRFWSFLLNMALGSSNSISIGILKYEYISKQSMRNWKLNKNIFNLFSFIHTDTHTHTPFTCFKSTLIATICGGDTCS